MPKCSGAAVRSPGPGRVAAGTRRRPSSWCCWTRPGRRSRPTARAARRPSAESTSPEATRVATPLGASAGTRSAGRRPSRRAARGRAAGRGARRARAGPCARRRSRRPRRRGRPRRGRRPARVCASTSAATSKDSAGSKPRISLVAATSVGARAPSRATCRCSAASGAGQAMIVLQGDERRPGRLRPRGLERRGQRLDVDAAVRRRAVDALHVPAVGLVARDGVLGEGDRRCRPRSRCGCRPR